MRVPGLGYSEVLIQNWGKHLATISPVIDGEKLEPNQRTSNRDWLNKI